MNDITQYGILAIRYIWWRDLLNLQKKFHIKFISISLLVHFLLNLALCQMSGSEIF